MFQLRHVLIKTLDKLWTDKNGISQPTEYQKGQTESLYTIKSFVQNPLICSIEKKVELLLAESIFRGFMRATSLVAF